MITGQVGIVPAANNFGSWIVVWVTRSTYTHVVVAVNEHVCLSLEPGREGGRLRPVTDYPDVIWSRFRYTPRQRRAMVVYARNRAGEPYGWFDYLITGVMLVLRRPLPRWARKHISRNGRTVCSQMAYQALKAAGVRLPGGGFEPSAAVATPGDFGRYYVQQGWANEP